MHIGIVAPCSSGGLADLLPSANGRDLGWGGYLIATLVRALIERGNRVSVITLCPGLKERVIFHGPRLTFYVYPTRTHKRMRDFFKLEREGLSEGILLANPDVLHAHWTYEFALACMETNIPNIITIHDNALQVLKYSRDMYRLGRLYMQIHVMRRAHLLSAVSPYLADSLRWLAQADIEVVPNPVTVPDQSSGVSSEASGRKRIATVINGWGRLKNSKAAIQAFQLVRRKMPEAELFMYGENFEEYGPAHRWALRKGITQNVRFCGFQSHDELPEKLRQMSLLLHPSLEEACPMTLLEAMATGLPVLGGADSGAVPWVLDHGRAGFLTDVRHPEQIAASLLRCLEQEEERKYKQKIALERVLSIFSPRVVVEKYEQLYAKALGMSVRTT